VGVQESLNKLSNWNLEQVKAYAVGKKLYTEDEINEVEKEYKRYLVLAVSYLDHLLMMSSLIDLFWYVHQIFSKNIDRFKKNVDCVVVLHQLFNFY
jgi:hypothetical protein